ncbi:Multidrug resistance efflux pump [Shimia gijangensis]|uniref:Multidrug resistance efflux pump n=1 Tax=Shimia gijangensis TaxID=1470563 RepID=A0A1M6NIX9_9RHOB|nr:biotin/lipoyl-binding protein [Shimia gijangensis]SHJ95679.1 Multidrug resistance efflux pump [Shimia gijangensis]
MFELLFTSFPAIIRYFQLKRRGEKMTVWNMKTAVFLWAILAFCLFLTIFYYHPKTYAGVVPFRTVSVVSQTTGPVTEINVINGQEVKAGDLLFRIEDSAQQAALKQAQADLALLDAEQAKAKDNEIVAQSAVDEAEAQLAQFRDDLKDAQTLLQRGAGRADDVLTLQTSVSATEAELRAVQAQLDLARIDMNETIPAQIESAKTAIASAQVALDFTEVRSLANGHVTQLSLSVGSPATTLVLRPAMIIIPDRPEDVPVRITAGFSQVARNTLYDGMPAEIACESNANLGFKNSVMPAHVLRVQPAIATGQVVPDPQLLDMAAATARGTVLVFLELVHEEHEAMLLDGSGCIVQTYTNNIHGTVGHIIGATGVIKAVGLRLKVLGSIMTGVGLLGGGH